MKILVPVDFNNTSFAAYRYASMLAKKLDATITLLHVISGTFHTGEVIHLEPLTALEDTANNRLNHFAHHHADDVGVSLPVRSSREVVRWGIAGFSIRDYAEDHEIDLIVMGARDKYNFFDRLLGTASSMTIRRSRVPIVLIHQNTPIKAPQKIAFAVDSNGSIEDALESFKELNDSIRAHTVFVHVAGSIPASIRNQKEEIGDELAEDDDKAQFTYEVTTIPGKNISAALKDFCLFEQVDILTMVHQEAGFFKSLFADNRSVKIAQDFHLPVLIYNSDTI